MTMATVGQLFIDLHDCIIDFLYDDHDTLKNCSLVCRSWVRESRTHLFYRVVLEGGPSTTESHGVFYASYLRFRALLEDAPDLAAYVRDFGVHETVTSHSPTDPWITEDISFPALLKKLRFLKRLQFWSACPSDVQLTWSPTALKGISDALSSLTVESLRIDRISFNNLADFAQVIQSCRHLDELILLLVDILSMQQPDSLEDIYSSHLHGVSTPKKHDLRVLKLNSDNCPLLLSFFNHSHSPFQLSALQQLEIKLTSENYLIDLDLPRYAPNLEDLALTLEGPFDLEDFARREPSMSLKHHIRLQLVSFVFTLRGTDQQLLQWMVAFLSTASANSKVEMMTIVCRLDETLESSIIPQASESRLSGWRDLDGLLSASKFPLEGFILMFIVEGAAGSEWAGRIFNCLKTMKDKHDLRIVDDLDSTRCCLLSPNIMPQLSIFRQLSAENALSLPVV